MIATGQQLISRPQFVFLNDATLVGKLLLLYYNTVVGTLSFVTTCTCAQNNKTATFVWGHSLLVVTDLLLLT